MPDLEVKVQSPELEALIKQFDKLSKAEQRSILASSALGRTLDATTRQGTRGMRSFGDSARNTVMAVASVAGAITLIHKAISLATGEWDRFLARLEAAKATNIDLATAQARATTQAPKDLSGKPMFDLVARVAAKSGATERDVYAMASGPFSARGNQSNAVLESVMTVTNELARLTGKDPEVASSMAGGLLDITRVLGMKGDNAGLEALGWLRTVGSNARVDEPEKQVRALAPALSTGNLLGVEPKETAALFSWLSQQAADVEGRKSSTATIDFETKVMSDVELGMKLVSKTFKGRLEELAQTINAWDVDKRDKFIAQFGGQAKFKGAFRALLTGDQAAMKDLSETRGKTPAAADQKNAAWGNQFFQSVRKHPSMVIKESDDASKRINERMQLTDPQVAAGTLRDNLATLLRSAGETGMADKIAKVKFDFNTFAIDNDPFGPMEDALRELETHFGTPTFTATSQGPSWDLNPDRSPTTFGRSNPDYSPERLEAIREYRKKLEELRFRRMPGESPPDPANPTPASNAEIDLLRDRQRQLRQLGPTGPGPIPIYNQPATLDLFEGMPAHPVPVPNLPSSDGPITEDLSWGRSAAKPPSAAIDTAAITAAIREGIDTAAITDAIREGFAGARYPAPEIPPSSLLGSTP